MKQMSYIINTFLYLLPQIRLWLTIVRVYKLYLLTYLLTIVCHTDTEYRSLYLT